MYAVIATGGKQYKVIEGQVLHVEKLAAESGETIDFNDVLLIGNGDDISVGRPYVPGGKVSAQVIEHGKGEKIRIIKMRRRKHSEKQMGHRQPYTAIKITAIAAAA